MHASYFLRNISLLSLSATLSPQRLSFSFLQLFHTILHTFSFIYYISVLSPIFTTLPTFVPPPPFTHNRSFPPLPSSLSPLLPSLLSPPFLLFFLYSLLLFFPFSFLFFREAYMGKMGSERNRTCDLTLVSPRLNARHHTSPPNL